MFEQTAPFQYSPSFYLFQNQVNLFTGKRAIPQTLRHPRSAAAAAASR
jgi:hypothetical protein